MKDGQLNYLSFVSAEKPNLWSKYQAGLRDVLIHFGVDQVVLSTAPHQLSEDTYVIIAFDKNNFTLGGIRLEIKSSQNKIPLEKIEHQIRERLSIKIKIESDQSKGKLAEVCGLWVSREAKGLGIGSELAYQATRLATDLKIHTLVSLLPTHTLNYFLSLGYQIDPSMPRISYPDDRYISTVVWYYVPDKFLRNSISQTDSSL